MIDQMDRVKRGVEFLNENYPGWEDDIDLDKLSMRSCKHCILGQLFGSYRTGFRSISLQANNLYKYGFEAIHTGTADHRKYAFLTMTWITAIKNRR